MNSAETRSPLPIGWRVEWSESGLNLVERVLAARGYTDIVDQEQFLAPNFERDTYDPFLMIDLEVAVNRLIAAKERGEQVAIYGDYDADGVPGAALLYRALKNLGLVTPKVHISTREEGYGLSAAVLKKWRQDGVTLVLTVDTGSSELEAVATAQQIGLEIIVTDHHELRSRPPAVAVVNPKQASCPYPNKHLCGTAVAYKLMWALYEKLGINHTYLKWQLDLVALATVTDMVPLVGENRALSYFGLSVLRRTRNVGLASLIRLAGVNQEEVNEWHIGFALGPAINAPSRLGEERAPFDYLLADNIVFTLLVTDDANQANELAALMLSINQSRKGLVNDYVSAIKEKIGTVPEGGLVYFYPSLPVGLTGLVAGRLADESGWPCLVMGQKGDAARGSGRSPTTLSLVDLLAGHEELLTKFGGHRQAAGWSLLLSELPSFLEKIAADLKTEATEHRRGERVLADTYLLPGEGDVANLTALQRLAPFGEGNPRPVLLVLDKVTEVRPLGDGRHCRLRFGGDYPEAVWFNAPEFGRPQSGQRVTAAANLELNTYNGYSRPQLLIRYLFIHD